MGVRASGSLSRITLDEWIKRFRCRPKEIVVKGRQIKKTVDDIKVAMHNLPPGSRLIGIAIRQAQRQSERTKKLS